MISAAPALSLPSGSPHLYAVVRFHDGWKILHGGRRLGRFESQGTAVEFVMRLARDVAGCGYPVEVLVQDACGEMADRPITRH